MFRLAIANLRRRMLRTTSAVVSVLLTAAIVSVTVAAAQRVEGDANRFPSALIVRRNASRTARTPGMRAAMNAGSFRHMEARTCARHRPRRHRSPSAAR